MTYKPATPKKKSWQGRALVLDIIDGDTLKCEIDLGFKISLTTNVRVLGCNCPELPTPEGVRALNFTRTLLTIGDIVTVDSKRLDLYGRAEAVITLADASDLGARLIGSGHAVRATDRGNITQKESQPGVLPGLASNSSRENTAHQ